jgi:hypothetical protein
MGVMNLNLSNETDSMVRDVACNSNNTYSLTIPIKLFKRIYSALPEGFKVVFTEHNGRLYGIFVSPAESVDEIVHDLKCPFDEDQRDADVVEWFKRYTQLMRERPTSIPAPKNTRPPTAEELKEESEERPLPPEYEVSEDGKYTTYYNRPPKKEEQVAE